MIKYHYHTARTSVPRLDVEAGDRLCHVYSDESLEELVAWGREHGLKADWVDTGHDLPHYDVAVERLEGEPEGVERAELVEDIRRWRERRRGEGQESAG